MGFTVSGDNGHPAIVFLHGFLGSSRDWGSVAASLKTKFHCIAVDLPGHGTSVRLPQEMYTFEGAAYSVIQLLDELQVDQSALVGYSMGGRLALYLALKHPERFTGLFLESASPGLESEKERRSRRITDDEIARRLENEDFDQFLRHWYRQPLFTSLTWNKELLEGTINARRNNAAAELAKSLRGMGTGSQPSLWEAIDGLRVSTVAVAGELDEKFIALAGRMTGINPQIRRSVVLGAGHNVRVEAPKAYLVSLKECLQRI